MTVLRRLRNVRLRLLPPRGLVGLVALVVLASACEVRTRVEVSVEQDGSGTVEVAVGLDRAALARVPDLDGDGTSGVADLAALVRTEDLEAAGWRVVEPREAGSGTTWIRVSKPFGTPEEANAVLAEVTGPEGPLRDLRLSRSSGFASTELSFSGTADLSGGLEAFADSGLAQALDGEPLGEDAAVIEQRLGEPLSEAFRLDVIVDLPGSIDANTDDRSGGAARWSPRLGGEAERLSASGSVRDWPVVLITVLAVAFLAAAVLAAARLLLVRPRAEPEAEPEPDRGPAPEPTREPRPPAAPGREPIPEPASGLRPPAEPEPVAGTASDAPAEPTRPAWLSGPPEPTPEPEAPPERAAAGPAEGAEPAEGADQTEPAEGDDQGGAGAVPEPDVPGWHHPPPVTD